MKAAPIDSVDVLGLGCVAVDDVLYVASYPAPDEKMKVARSVRRFGGLTGAALVTAARLGARSAYAGCLGADEFSQHIADRFMAEGISLAHAPRPPQGRVVHSVIVVSQETGSRNIFYETNGMLGAHPSEPPEEVVRAAKVLFIDQYGMEGNLRASRLARSVGIPVVADLEDATDPLFPEVLELVDHLVLSEGFARVLTRTATAAEAALALWRDDRAAVVVTCGAQGSWSVSSQSRQAARHHPAFPVKAADTTGCGDVFHGAYAACLARGDGLDRRIQFAAAAAALKARDAAIPHLAEVEQFLIDTADQRR